MAADAAVLLLEQKLFFSALFVGLYYYSSSSPLYLFRAKGGGKEFVYAH